MLVCGVDEAGRGCVFGPLVVAGVVFDEDRVDVLRCIGVKDSKLLTPKEREEIAEKIKSLALRFRVVEVAPAEIDFYVLKGKKLQKLNWLEAKVMAKVIEELNPDVAYIDASDVNAERFGRWIGEFLTKKIRVVSEHNADRKWLIVSAASILAKVHRDKVISELKNVYGDFGSGYPHDPKTVKFLEEWIKTHKKPPESVRRSWKTIKKLLIKQDKLSFSM
ncbi:MAG: ribonuclease HII [Candidatus Bathyarchaeota archaeon]|nr:ribonuclease HII [Candidatus Bathyarchaeota archaeon]